MSSYGICNIFCFFFFRLLFPTEIDLLVRATLASRTRTSGTCLTMAQPTTWPESRQCPIMIVEVFSFRAIGDISSSHILTIGINADGGSLRLLGT